MPPAERRIALSARQFQILKDAQQRVVQTRNAAQEAAHQLDTISALVFDAHGLGPDAVAALDATTGELVVHGVPAPPTPARDAEAPPHDA